MHGAMLGGSVRAGNALHLVLTRNLTAMAMHVAWGRAARPSSGQRSSVPAMGTLQQADTKEVTVDDTNPNTCEQILQSRQRCCLLHDSVHSTRHAQATAAGTAQLHGEET